MIESERRRHARMNCDIPVIEEENFSTVGTALNIGTGGCFIKTDRFLIMNSKIDTSFELPYTLSKIRAKGEVIRYDENPHGMAIEFNEMEEDNRIVLEQYIRDFDK